MLLLRDEPPAVLIILGGGVHEHLARRAFIAFVPVAMRAISVNSAVLAAQTRTHCPTGCIRWRA